MVGAEDFLLHGLQGFLLCRMPDGPGGKLLASWSRTLNNEPTDEDDDGDGLDWEAHALLRAGCEDDAGTVQYD